LLNRRNRKKQQAESSDDENFSLTANHQQQEEATNGTGNKQYRDLETFQKAQLRQKVLISFHTLELEDEKINT
jgi:hypothetical protein